MWVAKIKINCEKALIGKICKKYKISASGYPISTQMKENEIYLYFILFIFGAEGDKKKFLRDLRRSERTMNIETNGDFIIGFIKEGKATELMYKHNLVHVEPVKFSDDGYEIWTIASWNKKELMDFTNFVDEVFGSEILKMKKEKISNISILTMQPELTLKQKGAMELAIQHGYYECPRKIDLKRLAGLNGVCFSTYQAHLRKAERKLLPFFFERTK